MEQDIWKLGSKIIYSNNILSLFLNDKVINTSLRRFLEAVEGGLVQYALKSTNGNITTAKKLRKHVITGDKMLYYQAMEQFKIWTGKKAPALVMKEALNRSLV